MQARYGRSAGCSIYEIARQTPAWTPLTAGISSQALCHQNTPIPRIFPPYFEQIITICYFTAQC